MGTCHVLPLGIRSAGLGSRMTIADQIESRYASSAVVSVEPATKNSNWRRLMMRLSILSLLLVVILFAVVFALFAWLREEAFFYITGPMLGAMLAAMPYRRDHLALITGGAVGGLGQGTLVVPVLKHGYIVPDIATIAIPNRDQRSAADGGTSDMRNASICCFRRDDKLGITSRRRGASPACNVIAWEMVAARPSCM